MSKRFTFLGTGTSSGIPTVGCPCEVCNSNDPKDKRLRSSLLIESENTTVLIDTSPDLRQQMLMNNIKKIDAVIYTHHHFDHIGGFDDLRAFNYTARKPVPVYLMERTFENLKKTFFYAFGDLEQEGGGVPVVDINFIDEKTFNIGDIVIKPIPLLHGKMKVLGFRIGNFAYCTDTNIIPENSFSSMKNLDILVLDALRYNKHETHFTVDDAIKIAGNIDAKSTYFTHMAHEVSYAECEKILPKNFHLAYDGLILQL
ncbi:MBL fold metallo-hydrolase [Bacteroidota bacterium]